MTGEQFLVLAAMIIVALVSMVIAVRIKDEAEGFNWFLLSCFMGFSFIAYAVFLAVT